MGGYSTSISLPEKADLVVAEICGSVASEEGLYATMQDARNRFLKRPDDPLSFIPTRVQTYAAPASYALHYVLGPPQYDWEKLGEPVRFNCQVQTVQLLSDPQLIEDIGFDQDLPVPGKVQPLVPLTFNISADRLKAGEQAYRDELTREGAGEEEANTLSKNVARSLSGLACWPQLILDTEGQLVVRSRGPSGEARKSHWQTVVPILSSRPVPVQPGSIVNLAFSEELSKVPNKPL